MNKKFVLILIAIIISLSIAAIRPEAGISQGSGPGMEPNANTPGAIPIQGRLTNSAGVPLNGTYSLTFSLYEVDTGGTAICSQVRSVTVSNGLFSDYLDNCYNQLKGQKVWLGIKVDTDLEMSPRQLILAVPYALALRPGAEIAGTYDGILTVRNESAEGGDYDALLAYASGSGEGVSGHAIDGAGVYGYSDTGQGVLAHSVTGSAIQATGTGIITSAANSYVWISGNSAIKWNTEDSTDIDHNGTGAAVISRGDTAGSKYIIVPITISGPIYGQNVTITGIDIYWQGQTEFTTLSQVRLRRQTGPLDSDFVDILWDPAAYVCDAGNYADGCIQSWSPTSNNILTADSGILYMVFTLNFSGPDDWMRFGGVRLTLAHD